MKKIASILGAMAIMVFCMADSCDYKPTSNDVQRDRQERVLSEGASQVGIPAIHNFREMKLLKDIYEMRDQDGLVTYTYTYNEMTGKKVYFCDSIGYGIPYATQFTAGQSVQRYNLSADQHNSAYWGSATLPQAEPNGLFPPSSAEGTWVLCKDPNGKDVKPVYVEPRVIVSPFKLPE